MPLPTTVEAAHPRRRRPEVAHSRCLREKERRPDSRCRRSRWRPSAPLPTAMADLRYHCRRRMSVATSARRRQPDKKATVAADGNMAVIGAREVAIRFCCGRLRGRSHPLPKAKMAIHSVCRRRWRNRFPLCYHNRSGSPLRAEGNVSGHAHGPLEPCKRTPLKASIGIAVRSRSRRNPQRLRCRHQMTLRCTPAHAATVAVHLPRRGQVTPAAHF